MVTFKVVVGRRSKGQKGLLWALCVGCLAVGGVGVGIPGKLQRGHVAKPHLQKAHVQEVPHCTKKNMCNKCHRTRRIVQSLFLNFTNSKDEGAHNPKPYIALGSVAQGAKIFQAVEPLSPSLRG